MPSCLQHPFTWSHMFSMFCLCTSLLCGSTKFLSCTTKKAWNASFHVYFVTVVFVTWGTSAVHCHNTFFIQVWVTMFLTLWSTANNPKSYFIKNVLYSITCSVLDPLKNLILLLILELSTLKQKITHGSIFSKFIWQRLQNSYVTGLTYCVLIWLVLCDKGCIMIKVSLR